jgi:hypothetical protein
MGGNLGIPDVSQLPIQSDVSQYNLRNANAAFSPQPTAPPGAIGPTLSPDESIAELQQNATASFLRPQDQYAPQFDQSQLQQQPEGPDQYTPLEQQILAGKAARQHQGRTIGGLMSNLFGGMGRAMMLHAGLPTPEMQDAEDNRQLLAIQNARLNEQYKNLEAQKLRIQVNDRVPYTLSDGRRVLVTGEQAAQLDREQQERAARQVTLKDRYEQTRAEEIRQGLPPGQLGSGNYLAGMKDEEKQAVISVEQQKLNDYLKDPSVDKGVPLANRNAATFDTWQRRPRAATGAGTGGLGSDREIVSGMIDGTLDINKVASLRGGERERLIALAKRQDPTFNMMTYQTRLKLQEKFTSGKAADQITSLNTFSGHVGDASDLVDSLRNSNSPWLNRPMNAVAVGLGYDKIAPFQAALEAAKDEYLGFLKAGHAPQQAELRLADQLINPNQSPAQLQATLKQMAHTVLIRAGSLNSEYRRTMGKDYPLLNSDAATALSKLGFGNEAAKFTGGLAGSAAISPSGPPPGATMKVRGSDGKKHWSDGKQDLGLAE